MTTTESTTPVLSSTHEALQTARSVAATIAAGVVERELTGTWPEQELRQVAASGLLGIIVPATHGGPDLPQSTAVEVLRILSQADSAVGQLLLSHFVLSCGDPGSGGRRPGPADLRRCARRGANRQRHRRAGYPHQCRAAHDGGAPGRRHLGAQRQEVLCNRRARRRVDRGRRADSGHRTLTRRNRIRPAGRSRRHA